VRVREVEVSCFSSAILWLCVCKHAKGSSAGFTMSAEARCGVYGIVEPQLAGIQTPNAGCMHVCPRGVEICALPTLESDRSHDRPAALDPFVACCVLASGLHLKTALTFAGDLT
jgi:hypothetical protein